MSPDAPHMMSEEETLEFEGVAIHRTLETLIGLLLRQHDRALNISRHTVGFSLYLALCAMGFGYVAWGGAGAAMAALLLLVPFAAFYFVASPTGDIFPNRSHEVRRWVDLFNAYGKRFGHRVTFSSTSAEDLLNLHWQIRNAVFPKLATLGPPVYPSRWSLLFGGRLTPY